MAHGKIEPRPTAKFGVYNIYGQLVTEPRQSAGVRYVGWGIHPNPLGYSFNANTLKRDIETTYLPGAQRHYDNGLMYRLRQAIDPGTFLAGLTITTMSLRNYSYLMFNTVEYGALQLYARSRNWQEMQAILPEGDGPYLVKGLSKNHKKILLEDGREIQLRLWGKIRIEGLSREQLQEIFRDQLQG